MRGTLAPWVARSVQRGTTRTRAAHLAPLRRTHTSSPKKKRTKTVIYRSLSKNALPPQSVAEERSPRCPKEATGKQLPQSYLSFKFSSPAGALNFSDRDQTVILRRVDRSKYEYAGDIYECSRDTCKGGRGDENGTLSNSSCWHVLNYAEEDDKSYEQDDIMGCNDQRKTLCTPGANGPLCGTCECVTFYPHPSVGDRI